MKKWIARSMMFAVLAAGFLSGCSSLPGSGASLSPDAQLVADVRDRLSSDPVTGRYNISVTASGGVVTLAGNVADNSVRVRAKDVVRSAEGVKGVVDNLFSR
jgi:osmotically-inducible protein OsmY